MAIRNSLLPIVGRRLTLASFIACGLACGAVAAASIAATEGDTHAPPSKPAKPAAGPSTGHGATPPKTPATPATGKPAKGHTAEPAAPKGEPSKSAPAHGATDNHASDESHAATDAHAEPVAADDHQSAKDAHPAASPAAAHGETPSVSADEAIRRLVEGNARFVHDLDDQTPRDLHRRAELAGGQHPFAIVLSCADSRVPPELVFDQELGDLFVVRVAGNTADDAILGSMEYAIEHLGSRLIVVMGHTKCGAVKAAVDTAKSGKTAADLGGHLPSVVAGIMPAVSETKDAPGDAVRAAVIRNVQRTVASLRTCGPTINEFIASKGLKVIGALYDLETGEVDLLPDLSPSSTSPAAQTAGAGEPKHEEH